jgi:hypothetical protein
VSAVAGTGGDRRALAATGLSPSALYGPVEDWAERLHAALEVPLPCRVAQSFGPVWGRVVADLTEAGARLGTASYGGWNDGDRSLAEAIWCLVAHLRPGTLVETGVAHGLTSRVILAGSVIGLHDSAPASGCSGETQLCDDVINMLRSLPGIVAFMNRHHLGVTTDVPANATGGVVPNIPVK